MQFNKDLLYGFGDGAAWNRFLTVLLQSAHRRRDTTVESTADATNVDTAKTLANSLKKKINAHVAATDFHITVDSSNKIEAVDASDVEKLVALANEIKTDFNNHMSDKGHLVIDPKNEIEAANAAGTDDDAKTASAIVLLNEAKAKYNAHLANAWPI